MNSGKRNESLCFKQTKLVNTNYRTPNFNQMLKTQRLQIGEKADARVNTFDDPSNRFGEDYMTECKEEPTQSCLRRWNVCAILCKNATKRSDQALFRMNKRISRPLRHNKTPSLRIKNGAKLRLRQSLPL